MNDKPTLAELPGLLASELDRLDPKLNSVSRDILCGILDDAVARVAVSETLAYERLENMLFAEQRATDAEIERDEAVGRAEAAEASAAELERINVESYRAYLTLKEKEDAGGEPLREACRQNMTLAARVAELEAALAAERAWSSASEPPEESGDYIGYDGKSVMCVRFDAHEDADEDWPWADMDGTFVPVTRWQVLPPAPQEPR